LIIQNNPVKVLLGVSKNRQTADNQWGQASVPAYIKNYSLLPFLKNRSQQS
jgi:hypothetical protein